MDELNRIETLLRNNGIRPLSIQRDPDHQGCVLLLFGAYDILCPGAITMMMQGIGYVHHWGQSGFDGSGMLIFVFEKGNDHD